MVKAERELRQAVIDNCLRMNAMGINQGTSGNISARYKDVMLMTPTGVPYDELEVEDVAAMTLTGKHGDFKGPKQPSSEWRFHLDIMRARDDVHAIVHTHSMFATTLAIANKGIPACHYMIAAVGGPTVRCADYATFGTQELSDNALVALEGRNGCLLANHGMIVTGPNLKKTLWLASEMETLARQYYMSLSIGGPVILPDDEIDRVQEKFKTYGLRSK